MACSSFCRVPALVCVSDCCRCCFPLMGFDLLRQCGPPRCALSLRDGRVLQFDLSCWRLSSAACRGGDARLGLGDSGLHNRRDRSRTSRSPALTRWKSTDSDLDHLTRDPTAQLRQIRPDVGIVCGLDRSAADPGIPAHRCQNNESERGQHSEHGNDEAAPSTRRCRRRRGLAVGRGPGLSRPLILRAPRNKRLEMPAIMPHTVFSGHRHKSLIRHTSQRGLRARQM